MAVKSFRRNITVHRVGPIPYTGMMTTLYWMRSQQVCASVFLLGPHGFTDIRVWLSNFIHSLYRWLSDMELWCFFSCDQAALRMAISICPSVTPFWQCSCHRIIMKFSGVITNDRSDVHANSQGQRSKIRVTEVMTPFSRFRTVTPVWIYIWWWNDA